MKKEIRHKYVAALKRWVKKLGAVCTGQDVSTLVASCYTVTPQKIYVAQPTGFNSFFRTYKTNKSCVSHKELLSTLKFKEAK